MSDLAWETHAPHGPTRVTETSCCAEYEWACEGGQYFVLRRNGTRYEETGRGRYAEAREVWNYLVANHAHKPDSGWPRRWNETRTRT